MNSIIDLNTPANISYNNQSAYVIALGNSAGNVTANIDNFTTQNVTKQVAITTLTDPVRDVLVDWNFSNVGVVTMAYTGPWSNISLLPVTSSSWRAYGIRSIAQYDEAMANVKYTDISGGTAPNPDYNYLTVINDQDGNSRSWLTTLNVIANPAVGISGNLVYNEDTLTNVTIANVVVEPGSVLTFTLISNINNAAGTLTNGISTGNSVTLSGTANSLNSQLAANVLQFQPAFDYKSNLANALTFTLVRSGNTIYTTSGNIQIGNINSNVVNITDRVYVSNTLTQIYTSNVPYIDDGTDRGQSYTISFSSPGGKFGPSDAYFASNSFANLANVYTITGNMPTINAIFAGMRFAAANGNVGNTTYNYTQSRDGTAQANITANLTANVQPFVPVTYTFTTSQTWTPSFSEATYGRANRILLVGGGGGAAYGNNAVRAPTGAVTTVPGGGGGGGEIQYRENISLPYVAHTVQVGSGGTGGLAVNFPYTTGTGGGTTTLSAPGLTTIEALGGSGGQGLFTRSGLGWAALNFGGNGGGRLVTVGNTVISTSGLGGGRYSSFSGNGLPGNSVGNLSLGNIGGGGGAEGENDISSTTPNWGGAGNTHPLTGNLVLGGGGATRPVSGGATSTDGGNSYGKGGNNYQNDLNYLNGTAGVVVVEIVAK